MKRRIIRIGLLLIGCVIVIMAFMGKNDKKEYSLQYYDSSLNMKSSLEEIEKYLVKQYSTSKYVGTATIKMTYDSFGVTADNIAQSTMNDSWNARNPLKPVDGTCAIVANTMLFRKYMQHSQLMNVTAQYVFDIQASYAWQTKMFTQENHYALYDYEQVTLANHYLSKTNGDFTANMDSINLWNTSKSYLNDKIKPITLYLTGMDGAHTVLATDCYVERVTYKMKNTIGITVTKTADYKIYRICNGWKDTIPSDWKISTHSYVYFNCVDGLMKLK